MNIHSLYGALMHQIARRGGLHVLRVFSRPLLPVPSGTAPPGLELRPLAAQELLFHSRDPELELREAMVREAAQRGDRCLGAVEGGILVGYVWFAYTIAPHVDGIWVKVPPRAVYRFKAFVRPSHRGRGIATALYGAADPVVGKAGLDTVVDCVAVQNLPSITASLRSGSLPLGALAYWQAGRRFFALHSPAVRRLGLTFYLA